MKRLAIVVAVMMLLCMFAACSKEAAEEPTTTTPEANAPETEVADPADEETEAPTTKKTIGFDMCEPDPYEYHMLDAMKMECDERGWELLVTLNSSDNATATSNIESFITRKVDYIMSYCVDEGLQVTIGEMCTDAGIPVVFTGCMLDGYYTVVQDNIISGTMQAEHLVEAVKEQWDGQVDKFVLLHNPGAGTADVEKRDTVVNYCCENLGITEDKIVDLDGAYDVLQSTTAFANFLTANPDDHRILVWGFIDTYHCMGTINAAEAAGRIDDIILAGMFMANDATPDYLKEYPENWIGQCAFFGLDCGNTFFKFVDAWEKGEEPENYWETVEFVWIDGNNVDEYYPIERLTDMKV